MSAAPSKSSGGGPSRPSVSSAKSRDVFATEDQAASSSSSSAGGRSTSAAASRRKTVRPSQRDRAPPSQEGGEGREQASATDDQGKDNEDADGNTSGAEQDDNDGDPEQAALNDDRASDQEVDDSDDNASYDGHPDDLEALDLVKLHPTVQTFLRSTALHNRTLDPRVRRQLLRAFPPVEDFSASPPAVDSSFAAAAHPATLRRDRELSNITSLQLQALRPLLHAWSALCQLPQPDEFELDMVSAIKTAIRLSMHAVATTSAIRRDSVLRDVNPSLIKALRPQRTTLFGEEMAQQLEQYNDLQRTIQRLQRRPNGQYPGPGNNNSTRPSRSSQQPSSTRQPSSFGHNARYGQQGRHPESRGNNNQFVYRRNNNYNNYNSPASRGPVSKGPPGHSQ